MSHQGHAQLGQAWTQGQGEPPTRGRRTRRLATPDRWDDSASSVRPGRGTLPTASVTLGLRQHPGQLHRSYGGAGRMRSPTTRG